LRVAPDLGRIVLDPARTGTDLRMLLLGDGDDLTRLVEQDEAAARRALIDCADVPRHNLFPRRSRPTVSQERSLPCMAGILACAPGAARGPPAHDGRSPRRPRYGADRAVDITTFVDVKIYVRRAR